MISLPSSFTTSFLTIFLPKLSTKVLFASVPDREILKVNFVVLGTPGNDHLFSLRSGKRTVSNSSGLIADGLFVFMIRCRMPLMANPFLYDLCGLSLSPTSMIYICIYIP